MTDTPRQLVDEINAMLGDRLLASHEISGASCAGATIVDALIMISKSIDGLARQVRNLGTADAATPMGAIEAHADHMGRIITDAAEIIAGSMSAVATAISEHG